MDSSQNRGSGIRKGRIALVALAALCLVVAGAVAFLLLRGGEDSSAVIIEIGGTRALFTGSNGAFRTRQAVTAAKDCEAVGHLFAAYMSSNTLGEYFDMFRPGEAPKLSQSEFNAWQQGRTALRPTVLDIFLLSMSENRYAVAHYAASDRVKAHQGFIVKMVDGKWWPVTQEENKRFKDIKIFCTRIRPAALSLLQDRGNSGARSQLKSIADHVGLIQELRMSLATENGVISGSRLVKHLDALFDSEDGARRAFGEAIGYARDLLAQRSHDAPITDADRNSHQSLVTLLDNKGYSQIEMDAVLRDVKRGEMLTAAQRMMRKEGGASVYDYVLRLREIYGKDAIKIWDSRDQQLR